MVENRSMVIGIIAIILSISALWLGGYSIMNVQMIEGPQGAPGEDGQDGVNGEDGQDAPGGFIVRILDPDDKETVSGNVTIRTLIYGSESYTISILRNGTEIGNSSSIVWNTNSISDGWWNLMVIANDAILGTKSQDQVLVFVENSPSYWYITSETDSHNVTNASWEDSEFVLYFESHRTADYYIRFEAHVRCDGLGSHFESRFACNYTDYSNSCASWSTDVVSFSDSYVWKDAPAGSLVIVVQVKSGSMTFTGYYDAPSLYVQRL
ncbi:MAG: collagen-like protein [Candidatus Hermodarchaeota archaeon]